MHTHPTTDGRRLEMLDSQSGLKDLTLGKALGALPFVFQELTRNIPAFEIGWTTTRKT